MDVLIEKQGGIKYLLANKVYFVKGRYKYCFDKGIKTVIPDKMNAKLRFYRKKQQKNYSYELDHKRSKFG